MLKIILFWMTERIALASLLERNQAKIPLLDTVCFGGVLLVQKMDPQKRVPAETVVKDRVLRSGATLHSV